MLIVANWKAYVEDLQRAKALLTLSKRLSRLAAVRIVLAPPAALLGALTTRPVSTVDFAAQDVSATIGGATTGEVTAATYAAVGATYALVGHSERRTRGDTNILVAEKLAHALAHGLTPILCIGESERDTEGRYLGLIREQLTSSFSRLTLKERQRVIVAYEPLWAINTTAEGAIRPHDLAEIVLYIRKICGEFLPGKSSLRVPVLYGGSVESSNVSALAEESDIGGFLVGHASVDPRTFQLLIKALF